MATLQDSYAQWTTSTVLSGLGQRLVPVSNAKLLAKATQVTHSEASQTRAAAILTRLKELNAHVAQQFQPKLNALSNLNLRMICPAVEDDTEPTPSGIATYLAVSYCWHNKYWPLAQAAKDIIPGWEVSKPMMEAVMGLRKAGEGVWIDKLCINQDDPADKTTHIGVMDAIYHSARRIVILLEDVQLDKGEEVAGLTYQRLYEDLARAVNDAGLEGEARSLFIDGYIPDQEKQMRDKGEGHVLAPAKSFIMKILKARWFERGWCAHESRMAKHLKTDNPLFLCFGADRQRRRPGVEEEEEGKAPVLSFEFRFIHYMGFYLLSLEPPGQLLHTELETNNTQGSDPKTLQHLTWRIQSLMPDDRPTVSAMQHFVSVLPFGILKKGDLISIALNTAAIPLYFKYDGEDERSVEDVILKFTLLVLAANDLVPLIAMGRHLRIPSPERDILSWAIHSNQPGPAVVDQLENPLPGSITAVTEDYIELDLLIFESLPKPASQDSQAKATRLIAEHDLDAVADELFTALSGTTQLAILTATDAMLGVRPTSRPLHKLRHLDLSLALDNGLDWILAFPSSMLQATSTPAWMYEPLGDQTHPGLTLAVHSLLALFNTTPPAPPTSNTDSNSNKTPKPQPNQPPPTTTQEQIETLLNRALTTLLDPRLLLFTPNPRRLPLSRALGTAALTPAASNRSYIAVPTCLAHLPGRYDRAWVVEPLPHSDEPAGAVLSCEAELPRVDDITLVQESEDRDGKFPVLEGGLKPIEDVVPVLSSDYADRRAPRDDECGAWRVRGRQTLFGCSPGGLGLWGVEGREMLEKGAEALGGGEGVVLLRRQRVYGAEEYQWGRILEEMMKVGPLDGVGWEGFADVK
ncbi:hypothetical protein N658DRAFT_362154 [Parathielavia hyrcaniae]|uniref:Heterokaryon incompatibility domain-containing protein n=1 Tax=Parathielavia hyrcaniae TaxID=113614 RepID=A0AAN6PR28_9PEZI|nr:hypothetical protein N658DRAFT_362154 [Parathielavia hyrcaniae]